MAYSIGIMGCNLLTGIITARILGPEGRGIQTMMILWPQFLAFATTLGIHSALLYHMKKEKAQESELYYASLMLTLLAGVLAVIAGVALIPIGLAGQPSEIVISAQLFMAVTPFMLLYFLHTSLFRGREEFHRFNRLRYIVPLLSLALLVGLALSGRMTPFASGIAYLAPYVPVTLYALVRAVRLYGKPVVRRVRGVTRKVTRYGLAAYGIDLLGNLILYIDQIIVIRLLAPGPVGLYVVAVSLSRMLNIFSSSIVLVLFPKLSGLEAREAGQVCLKVFKLSTAGALICTGAVVLAAPVMIRMLYGAHFAEAIPVFCLLTLQVVLSGAMMVLGQAFMAVGRPFMVTIAQAIGFGLVIPLMYALVPSYGLIGAGLALLLPTVLGLLFMAVSFAVKFKPAPGEWLIRKADIVWIRSFMERRKVSA